MYKSAAADFSIRIKKNYSAYRTPVILSAWTFFGSFNRSVFIRDSEPGLRFVRCGISGPNFAARPGTKEI